MVLYKILIQKIGKKMYVCLKMLSIIKELRRMEIVNIFQGVIQMKTFYSFFLILVLAKSL